MSAADISDYLAGRKIYGDDFTQEEIAAWFEREQNGYYTLANSGKAYEYGYHAFNAVHGFSALKGRRFAHGLAFGCARGDEIEPIAGQIDRLTCVEPARKWWRGDVAGVPTCFVAPEQSGALPVADRDCDLLTCLGALHHIPNPTYILGEMARVLAPGGMLVMREPITTMGDWRKPRRGLTPDERGFPKAWLCATLTRLGFRLRRARHVQFPLTVPLGAKLVHQPFNSRALTLLDWLASEMTSWNLHYHRDTAWKKIAPGSIFIVASRG